jgi:hypothetical protein
MSELPSSPENSSVYVSIVWWLKTYPNSIEAVRDYHAMCPLI